MRLSALTPSMLRRAIEIYYEHAFPEESHTSPPRTVDQLAERMGKDQPLALFEVAATDEQRRHLLRLGNHGYPFMKLVLQEYILEGEYFLSVDTHDALQVSPEMPDYEAWCEVRLENRRLKEAIEGAWAEEGLPAHNQLRVQAERIAALGGMRVAPGSSAKLLVVDDERDVALGLAALLRAEGFEVDTAFDGLQVIEHLSVSGAPDLLLLDYSMPELDGEQVMERLRDDKTFESLPILLATASSIDLGTVTKANGLLRKPYTFSILCQMVRRLLSA